MDADELLVEPLAVDAIASAALSAVPSEDVEPEEGTMLCIACGFQIASFAERTAHYSTEWHRYNVKRRCAGLMPITLPQFQEKIAVLEQRKAEQEATYKCDACSKSFNTQASYQQHMSSKKHQKKVKGGSNHATPKASSLKPSNAVPPAIQLSASPNAAESKSGSAAAAASLLASDIAVVAASPAKDIANQNPGGPVVSFDSVTAAASAPSAVPAADSGEVVIIDGAQAEAEQDGDAADENGGEQVGIPLKHCLFCNRPPFKTVKASLDHMLKQHGFFIPFVEILNDLEGLLLYLGEKIGIGHVCLYCNGRGKAAYSSTQAVQQHMRDKFHCKIRFEEDEEDDEFIEFYDFPTEDVEEEDAEVDADAKVPSLLPPLSSTIADAKKSSAKFTSATVLPSGELDVGNGRILGHRSLQTYYKQNLKPEMEQVVLRPALEHQPKRSTALVAHLAGQYGSMQLVGWRRGVETEKVFQKFVRQQNKAHMKLGIAANKLQHHYRCQVMF